MKQCQEFIEAQQTKDMFHKNVNNFITLSESRVKLAWGDPQLKKMDAELKKITDRYLNDKNFINIEINY
jgi:hypothetical protein